MPANDKLQWLDIADMTGGQWDSGASATRDQFAAPQSAFRLLQDYVPMKGGGLRAFFKPVALSMTGIVNAAQEECMGIYARSASGRAGHGDGVDHLLATMNIVDFKVRIYRMDGTNGETTWKLLNTSAACGNASYGSVGWEFFTKGDNSQYYLMSGGAGDTGEGGGLWSIGTNGNGVAGAGIDGTCTQVTTYNGPIIVQQERVFVGVGGINNVLYYSDVGTLTFSNFQAIAPNRANNALCILSGLEPDDMMVGLGGCPWVEISGDIGSVTTAVREMGFDHYPRTVQMNVPRVPGGLAFAETSGRIFITDGRTFNAISNQKTRQPATRSHNQGCGTLAFVDDFLFAPGQGVYDFVTGAWLQQSTVDSYYHTANAGNGNMYIANNAVGFTVYRYPLLDSTSTRVSTGIIKSVPFADKNGRTIDLRELQLFVETYASTIFKVELLDEKDTVLVTRWQTVPTADKEVLSFRFPYSKSDYLSYRITPTAAGTAQAPTIERIRVGFGINNILVN